MGGKTYCRSCGKQIFQGQPPKGLQPPVSKLPSLYWALLSLPLPGIPLLIFRQPAKGFILFFSCFFLTILALPVPPLFLAVFFGGRLAALIDAFMVAKKLRRTGEVASWEFFPS
jgi:hypothetical protein